MQCFISVLWGRRSRRIYDTFEMVIFAIKNKILCYLSKKTLN